MEDVRAEIERDAADLLLLLTLDVLDMHDEAAQSALRMIASGTHSQVLLKVSFCSRATRNAIANGFVPEDIKYLDVLLPHRAIREKIRWDYQAHYRFPSFCAFAGNEQTIELLLNAAKWAEQEHQLHWKSDFEHASERISSWLALPS